MNNAKFFFFGGGGGWGGGIITDNARLSVINNKYTLIQYQSIT